MALRLASKINRNILQSITCRSVSCKPANLEINEALGNAEPVQKPKEQQSIKTLGLPLRSSKSNNSSTGVYVSIRNFSTKKLDDVCDLGPCKKFKLCNCDQQPKPSCNRPVIYKDCRKKEAPYPCFSETCYEDPYIRPSECKLCPWKAEDHPTFRHEFDYKGTGTPKRRYHTSARHFHQYAPPPPSTLENTNRNDEVWIREMRNPSSFLGYLCKIKQDKIPGCETNDCVKFPFKPSIYEKMNKNYKEPTKGNPRCIKEKKKPIEDCPPKGSCCDSYFPVVDYILAPVRSAPMMLSGGDGCGGKDCPKADRGKCDDPPKDCPKKKDKSKICPTDLLNRKNYKKKGGKCPKKCESGVSVPPTILTEIGNAPVKPSSPVISV